ncbi:MAG: hypothetical protein BWX82_00460 [Parcubacteria group bacterium ADurb.Bin115]|jgi:hypothetical protein|nr:MAG: hypothetical protein BWX82_00460 [Parcubacteria group bacterium ADurb.Bin115]
MNTYKACFNGCPIYFSNKNIFSKAGEVFVRNAKNMDEKNERIVPPILELREIKMNAEEKKKILHRFSKEKRKKRERKIKRPMRR